MITTSLYTHLSALALSANVYNGAFPQQVTFPAVLFTIRDEEYNPNQVIGQTPTIRATVQVDSCADSLATAYTLAETISQSLHQYHGEMGSVVVQWSRLDNSGELNQPPDDASDIPIYRVSQQYVIRYNVENPAPVP